MVGPNLVYCKFTKTASPIKGRKPALPHTRAGKVPHGGVPFYLLILRQPCCVVQAGLELSVLLFCLPGYQNYGHYSHALPHQLDLLP